MLDNEKKKMYVEEKNIFDMLKSYYLFDEDVEICNYVTNQLPYIELEPVFLGKDISLNELINMSLEEMRVFGRLTYVRTWKLISNIPVEMEEDTFFEFRHIFSFGMVSDMIDSSSIRNERYVIPKKIYEMSVYCMAHEHIHALKETNYAEARDTLTEVIPMFYELMIFNPDELLKKELIRCRISLLHEVKEQFIKYNNLLESKCMTDNIISCDEAFDFRGGLYDYMRLKYGIYLCGFYYALILYHMYKENPKKILNLVSKVLNKEMTTLDLLERLGIYWNIKGEIFEKELENIKRLVK